ncbi:MAG: type II toxin-antitoxin system VapC family toxin [Solirubrobacteraceae bacterium]
MRLLFDTHAALWWLSDDERLGPEAARHLLDERNDVLLSAAVVWEVGIKRSLGTLDAPPHLAATLLRAGAQALAVTISHADAAAALPWHHRDPFDRMLVAQAQTEGAAIVSRDEKLLPYGVPLVW